MEISNSFKYELVRSFNYELGRTDFWCSYNLKNWGLGVKLYLSSILQTLTVALGPFEFGITVWPS